jgi:tellurite resistance protein TehA-like permease
MVHSAHLQAKSNVVKIDKQTPAPAKRAKKRAQKNIQPSCAVAAVGILAVGLVLVGLSLSHLAEGVQLVTGSGTTGAWSMAIGIDLGFVALEVALLAAPIAIRPDASKYASPAIAGTLATSAP